MKIDVPDFIEKMIDEQAKAEQITASELIIKSITKYCAKHNPRLFIKSMKLSDVLQNNDISIDGLLFKQTCFACPEQYDVYQGDKKVAYVHLRHGHLSLSNADISEDWFNVEADNNSILKSYYLVGDDWFDDDNERVFYLTLFAKIIHKKLNNSNWQVNDDTQFLAKFMQNWQENHFLNMGID